MQILAKRDLRTLEWFGAGDWLTLTCILVSYCCTVKIFLPKYMANRKPFNIQEILRVYNLLLIAINVYFLYNLGKVTYFGGGYSWFCQGLNLRPTDDIVLRLNYYYMFVRIFEFLDTVFFVLRKKYQQASLLNISHHCIAVFLPWYGTAYGIDGQICLMVLFNMFVHVIMYTYYFLAAFPSMREHLGWKKYLTSLQIVQFSVVVVHMSIPLFHDCGYPPQHSIVVVSPFLYFLMMFSKFYISSYKATERNQTGVKNH